MRAILNILEAPAWPTIYLKCWGCSGLELPSVSMCEATVIRRPGRQPEWSASAPSGQSSEEPWNRRLPVQPHP